MNAMNAMRNVLLTFGLALATTSFGFVEDMPAGSQYHGEQSEEQLGQQQQMNGTYEVVGDENLRGDNLGVDGPHSEQSASDVLSQKEDERAKKVLRTVEEQKSNGTPWWMYLLGIVGVSAVISGCFMALKNYTDKNAPPPPSEKTTIKW